jgi:D-aminopeptidase
MGQMKIRDYGIKIGTMSTGKRNAISDVADVAVGHVTLDSGDIKTGVTAVIPHSGNLFKEKVVACVHVINGFGKSQGLVQINEMGTIETPIILTNTLGVGRAYSGLVKYMLEENDDIGITTGTVNPIVCECNDGYLNDIRNIAIQEEHVLKAISSAKKDFSEGDVGAGRGMVCYGLKGGIGSASRKLFFNDKEYTVGCLVLSNFGRLEDLTIKGENIGAKIRRMKEDIVSTKDQGSIIIVLATDIPLSFRQLKRVIKRSTVGIARTGGFTGSGSGEIAIGFSTSNKVNHYEEADFIKFTVLSENKIDTVFRAVSEATEEAILNSLICSNTTVGSSGHRVYSLRSFWETAEELKLDNFSA